MSALEQGVLVVEAYANSEREVGNAIQVSVSKAITQLNQEGKRVVNITAGPSVKYMLGVNHLTYLLWENNNIKYDTNTVAQSSSAVQASTVQQPKEEPVGSKENPNALCDVIMVNCGPKKIQVIQEIRRLFNWGLEEAHKATARENYSLKTGISLENAQSIKTSLEKLGATIVVKQQQ